MKRTLSAIRPAQPVSLPQEGTEMLSLVIDPQSAQSQGEAIPPAPVRRRARIHVTQAAVEEALQLTTDGKVSAKNAWDVKLIEGMQDSVTECLGLASHSPRTAHAPSHDAYAQFSRAATLVEGGAKVWGHRVESTYLLSNQLVRRLLRNEEVPEEVEANENAGNENTTQAPRRKKRTLERTIAETAEEINMADDSRMGGKDHISPMARAMTEKFDHAHAQGLLLNNVPTGAAGNLIVDRDEAVGAANRGDSAQKRESDTDVQCEAIMFVEGSRHFVAGGRVSETRMSQQQLEETIASQQAMAFVTSAREVDEHIDLSARGVRSREASVFSAVDADLVKKEEFDEDDDFGQLPFDADYRDDDDDDDDDVRSNEGEGNEAAFARSLVFGLHEQQTLDHKLALMAENPNGAWVPLSQETAHLHARGAQPNVASALLSRIRKECTAPTVHHTAEVPGDAQPQKKRRIEKKTVKFSSEMAAGPREDAENIEYRLRLNKTSTSCVSKLGRNLAPPTATLIDLKAFSSKTCEEESLEHKIVNRIILHFEVSSAPSATTVSVAQEWGPEHREAVTDVRSLYQPFAMSNSEWSLLRKTAKPMDATIGATKNIVRGGDDGGYEDEVVGEMPVNIFDDAPDDEEPEPSMLHIPLQLDLPDISAAPVEDAVELIQGPETIKVLKINHATVPTQVDVVRLRRCMWDATSRICATKQTASSKRGHQDDGTDSADDTEEDESTFANVVAEVLPHASEFAKDKTLSPAFFFFSMLFLANEHGLRLSTNSRDALRDIIVRRTQ